MHLTWALQHDGLVLSRHSKRATRQKENDLGDAQVRKNQGVKAAAETRQRSCGGFSLLLLLAEQEHQA